MADWPLYGGGGEFESFGTVADTGTTVTTSGSANTKGAWAELIASTAFEAHGFYMNADDKNSTTPYLYDVAIGGAGSEKVIIENICVPSRGGQQGTAIILPLNVPKGSRISARAQSPSTSVVLKVAGVLYGGTPSSPMSFQRCTTYGANESLSIGAPMNVDTSIGSKQGFKQIVASTTNPIRSLMLSFNEIASGIATGGQVFDIAVGSSGNEEVIIPDIFMMAHQDSDAPAPTSMGPFPVDLPAGVRLTTNVLHRTGDTTIIRCCIHAFD